jgi:phosphate transport system substrate-binding protein
MPRSATYAAIVLGVALLAPNATFADVSISAAGSTALLPLVKSAAETYQNQHPDVKIAVTGGGSRVGITQVAAKAVDLGDSDIIASKKDYPSLVDHKVAVVGFAVVVNPDSGVKNLTKKQVQDIFSGKVTNWKDVGGKDEKIVVVNRPRSSGTRAVFTQTIMGDVPVLESGLTEDATGTVISAVKTTPGAVSYAAFSGTHGQTGVIELSIDGVAASEEKVVSGKYPIWSYEHVFTNGQPSKDIAAFIDFIANDKQLLTQLGYIATGDMKVIESDR